jgi:hypothetical protein
MPIMSSQAPTKEGRSDRAALFQMIRQGSPGGTREHRRGDARFGGCQTRGGSSASGWPGMFRVAVSHRLNRARPLMINAGEETAPRRPRGQESGRWKATGCASGRGRERHPADAKRRTGASMHRADIAGAYYQLDSLQLKT